MLTELCGYLKNWFDYKQKKTFGDIIIRDGAVVGLDAQENQYYRIVGSTFNDGVYKYGDTETLLTDEEFSGAIWLMAVPQEVIQLAKDIEDWQDKYGGIDSASMSPYTSESFGGYSYSKSAGSATDGSSLSGWQAAFASRLSRWKKI